MAVVELEAVPRDVTLVEVAVAAVELAAPVVVVGRAIFRLTWQISGMSLRVAVMNDSSIGSDRFIVILGVTRPSQVSFAW